MKAYKLQVTVPPDRRVVMQLPADAPEGDAEVVILVEQEADNVQRSLSRVGAEGEGDGRRLEIDRPTRAGQTNRKGDPASLLTFLKELQRLPPSGRTKEDVDAYLEELRRDWE